MTPLLVKSYQDDSNPPWSFHPSVWLKLFPSQFWWGGHRSIARFQTRHRLDVGFKFECAFFSHPTRFMMFDSWPKLDSRGGGVTCERLFFLVQQPTNKRESQQVTSNRPVMDPPQFYGSMVRHSHRYQEWSRNSLTIVLRNKKIAKTKGWGDCGSALVQWILPGCELLQTPPKGLGIAHKLNPINA